MADYTFKIQRFNPDKDKKPHYEEYTHRARSNGSRVGWLERDQVDPGWDAHVSPKLCPWRVRLRCDAHQRPQPARLQGADQRGRVGSHHDRADARVHDHQGPGGRSRAVLRKVPLDCAVPDQRFARPAKPSVCSHPRIAPATTTAPSASCAPRAPRPARRSGRTRSSSAPPPSSTRTASSSTAAMKAPTIAWPC